jgi:hypothetical protein
MILWTDVNFLAHSSMKFYNLWPNWVFEYSSLINSNTITDTIVLSFMSHVRREQCPHSEDTSSRVINLTEWREVHPHDPSIRTYVRTLAFSGHIHDGRSILILNFLGSFPISFLFRTINNMRTVYCRIFVRIYERKQTQELYRGRKGI